MQRVAAGRGIEDADRAARFHRIGDDAVVVQVEPRHMRRRREGGLGRGGVADRPFEADAVPVACFGGFQRILDARDGGKRFVVDGDPLRSILRPVAGIRDDHGNRLAGVADRVRRQRVLGRKGKGFARIDVHRLIGGERADPGRRQIRAGEDIDDPARGFRGGKVDTPDRRVGVRGAQNHRVQHPVERHVVDIAARSRQEPGILHAARRIADLQLGHWTSLPGYKN